MLKSAILQHWGDYDMTEGHPLKLIMMFALPLLLGNIFQQTYNIVDTAIVGQTLGANALAAEALLLVYNF